ncbi:hypothetical protein [uncultured Enterococcus sp.]|uniref:hypothetical protein n=1 Tax=uncultured Enterococcus sp. TaxID=167972 RepID=UPI002594E315|nr:hypothetical protein [uncultured Enterococcus sp.]
MKKNFPKGMMAFEGFLSLFLLFVCLVPLLAICTKWLEKSKAEQEKIEQHKVLYESVLTQSKPSRYTINLSKEQASIYVGSDQIEIYQTDERIHTD